MRKTLLLCLLICLPLPAQLIPTATELPGDPFYVKKTWLIGGEGSWDSLTVDSAAQRLYVAHGTKVQVVDLDSGSLLAQIQGFRDAHAIALEDTGQFAYVTDGPARAVKVVDRERFVIDSVIPVGCAPHSITFEPANKLVFAVCGIPPSAPAGTPSVIRPPRAGTQPTQPKDDLAETALGVSLIAVIDAESRRLLAKIAMAGDFRFAVPDGAGRIYISVGSVAHSYDVNGKTTHESLPPRIAVLDTTEIVAEMSRRHAVQTPPSSVPLSIDWSEGRVPESAVSFHAEGSACMNPRELAIDANHLRLFAACDGNRLVVFNAQTGEQIASLRTGPGNERIGYDQKNGLLFAASGDGDGNLIIIRQSANTDSYAVIQNLPTRGQARTLAVDSSTGAVYLVTEAYGMDLTKKGGIGTLQTAAVAGSFQVLVVGH
jgi:DNA-binding beta-propeller fold protein YncE